MHQYSHCCHLVVNTIELTLFERPKSPQAGIDLFDRLAQVPFVLVMRKRIVKSRSAKSRQVFVIRARSAPDRSSIGE